MFLGAAVISEGILVTEAQERGLSPQGFQQTPAGASQTPVFSYR